MKDMQPNKLPASLHKDFGYDFDQLISKALEYIAKYADYYTSVEGAQYSIPVEPSPDHAHLTKPLH